MNYIQITSTEKNFSLCFFDIFKFIKIFAFQRNATDLMLSV